MTLQQAGELAGRIYASECRGSQSPEELVAAVYVTLRVLEELGVIKMDAKTETKSGQ